MKQELEEQAAPRFRLPGTSTSEVIERLSTPGGELALRVRHEAAGDIYELLLDGTFLMSSEDPTSERRLAELALAQVHRDVRPRVLVGGLGMGFTLRAALDLLPASSEVVVAELHPAVARWNETHLARLNANAVRDPRVILRVGAQGDVAAVIAEAAASGGRFSAVLLDVDNGPGWTVRPENAALYAGSGLEVLRQSLVAGGVAAIWSACPDPTFAASFRSLFGDRAVREEHIPRRRGADDVLYLGERGCPGTDARKSKQAL